MAAAHDINHASTERAGYRWFFGIGLVAVVFAYTLKVVDDRLSTSDREQRLGETLKELRTAQTMLPSRATDTRQTTPFLVQAPRESEEMGESDEVAQEHHSH